MTRVVENPETGAQKVGFAVQGRVYVATIAASADLEIDFRLPDLQHFRGRWVDILCTGGEAGFFFLTPAADGTLDPALPVLADITPDPTQCDEIQDGERLPGYLSKNSPVLRIVAGAAEVTIRISVTQV